MSKPRLISFKICPFVQRSIILLKEKKVDFDIEYIDLDNPPDWFLALSPMGKVPVLVVDDKPLFESAIICEYLEEVYGDPIHPADAFLKAQNRAWVEFTSNLYVGCFKVMLATEKEPSDSALEAIKSCLNSLIAVKQEGAFFNGNDFSMVDVAMAPAFTRFAFLKYETGIDVLEGMPTMQSWSNTLLSLDSVRESVVSDFATILRSRMQGQGSYIYANQHN